MKTDIIEVSKVLLENIKTQRKKIATNTSTHITNNTDKTSLGNIATYWFQQLSSELPKYGVNKDVVAKYDDAFKAILKLSNSISRRSSYEKQFDLIQKSFLDEVVIFLQTEPVVDKEVSTKDFSSDVNKLLEKIPDENENEYLQEALGCWSNGYLKAAVVLLWCAAIDRIHKVIEKNGFETFNNTAIQIKAQTTGRYKRFSKSFDIQSMNDLQMVFDSDILWVLEGMQLLDINEKTRLTSCFDMRCHAGHPGAAPITKYNVISCFSDIIEIVLSSPKFSLTLKQ